MHDDLPLDRYPAARTTSVDETSSIYETLDVPAAVGLAHSRSSFSRAANRIVVDRIELVATHYGCGLRSTGASGDAFHLHLAHRGTGVCRDRTGATELVAGQRGMIVSPNEPLVCEFTAGYAGMMISIPRATLESTLRAAVRSSTRGQLRFEPTVDVTSAVGNGLSRFIDLIVGESARPHGILGVPGVASSLVDGLLRALLELPNNHSDVLRSPEQPADPGCVRRAEEYIDANLLLPVTVDELARVTGVSVRALQAAFRIHRDSTPMEFLRVRRLELARRRLLSGDCGSIADVALECGFMHLSRFSARYRERFGEPPSETARRAR